ncbi:choline transporter-like protein 2 isoform X1 [Amphiura filiformis]|uniref:choline transporter-like protein 2 isoform X1 n=1 Tax=Amphiura filiformis TaxID=82378 RepID=UPI003B20D6C7
MNGNKKHRDKKAYDNDGAEFDIEEDRPPKKSPLKRNKKKSYYGERKKYDPTFHGPTEDRSCTDIICCLLFFVFVIGMVGLGGYAYYSGDPLTLIYATDYQGNVCGKTPGFEQKPFLFYFDLLECFDTTTIVTSNCPSTKICLERCPRETFAPFTLLLLDRLGEAAADAGLPDQVGLDIPDSEWDKMMCEYAFDPKAEYTDPVSPYFNNLDKIFEDKRCAAYYLKSEPLFERCIPGFLVSNESSVAEIFEEVTGYIATSDTVNEINITTTDIERTFQRVVNTFLDLRGFLEFLYQDFISSWWLILIGLAIGMALSLIWIILMRWIAGPMVWGSIFLIYGVLGVGMYFCYKQYFDLEDMRVSDPTFAFLATLSDFLRLQKTWLTFGIILLVIFLVILLVTLCLCNRIRLAVQLIAEASKAVGNMMSTLFFPIIPFFLQVIIYSLWAIIAVYLATSHEVRYEVYNAPPDFAIENGTECVYETFNATYNTNGTTATCVFVSYSLPTYTTYLQFVNLFGLFWISNFIIALGQVTLAGAFASYFWAYDKSNDVPALPLLRSFWWAIRYHLGSIAFGSLIIAIVKIIRVLLEYVQLQLKGKTNNVAKFLITCLQCCFWCLEKFLKFLNKNAYILVAIYGKNFCTSAKDAFFLLMRNIIRVAVINKITDFLLLLGTLCIVGLVTVAYFFYFSMQITFINDIVPVPELHYYWAVIIVISLGVFCIARGFFSVFDMAVDTMFLSFLEDSERHDGSPEKPYYMSKDLMQIVGKKNKKRKDQPDNNDEESETEDW